MVEVNVPVVFVIGGPGSGKGTQCEKIVEKYGFTHLSLGDLLREECNSGSKRGIHFATAMKEGKLISNREATSVLKEAIVDKLPSAVGFLVDGFPRDAEQVDLFEEQVVCPRTFALFLDVPDDTMKTRLLERGKTSGRSDDTEKTILDRIAVFHSHTEPILNRLGDKVVQIKAAGTPEEIFLRVVKVLDHSLKVRVKRCFVL